MGSANDPSRERPRITVTPARRLAFFVGADAALVILATALATLLRFEGAPPSGSAGTYMLDAFLLAGFVVAASSFAGTYRASWSFVGLRDVARTAAAIALGTTASLVAILAFRGANVAPTPSLAVSLIQAPLSFCALAGFRLSKRAVRLVRQGVSMPARAEPALILGAGDAGGQVLKSLQEAGPTEPIRVVGLLDDDPLAWRTSIHGVPILGAISELDRHLGATGARVVIICIARANSALVRRIVETCRARGVSKVRIVPTVGELVGGRLSFTNTREVTMEDLLGRDPVEIDMEGVRHALAGRSVLVTGGAGTIGAELCRQVASHRPRLLVLLDIDETRIHDLAHELADLAPGVPICQALVDVRDARGVEDVFVANDIDVVFHAAAYKHVPMMELWPLSALDVNVLGTHTVLAAARRNGCDRFVLISTDKAVEPSSVMGASKRLAEFALFGSASASGRDGLRVAAVRFGNVLGSRGSVLPLFERQLRQGRPLTVTHPDIERYFMMTSEAVQLVLQAAVMASQQDVFVLDMGRPVRILDVAREFVRLHGLEPDRDVPIVFTGLRPGEKLSESLHYAGEILAPTSHPRISKTSVQVTLDARTMVATIEAIVEKGDQTEARAFLERRFASLRDHGSTRGSTTSVTSTRS